MLLEFLNPVRPGALHTALDLQFGISGVEKGGAKWSKCIIEEGCSASVAWSTWKDKNNRRKLYSLAPTGTSAATECELLLGDQ